MEHLEALTRLQPIDRVCFLSVDQIPNVRTYMQVDDEASKIVIDLTDLLMPSLNGDESLCRQLHALSKSKYEDVVPAYNQELFSFYHQPGYGGVVILMRTSPAATSTVTNREPLERLLQNYSETERDCYIANPKAVQSFVIVNDGQMTAVNVTESVATAWRKEPSRSLCYHLYERFKMMLEGQPPSYDDMHDAYKFYTNDELGPMVVVLDGSNLNVVPNMTIS